MQKFYFYLDYCPLKPSVLEVTTLETDMGNVSKYVVPILLTMGAFGVMGGGLVAPGLPTIGAAFDAPEEQVGLILSIYTLAAAIGLPVIGYFIDSVGRRKVGISCLLLDGTAGLTIIFAPNFSTLLILRFFQGIGIAGLVPVAMTMIDDLFSGDKKLQMMGYLTGSISLGAMIIPTVGGALAYIHWRLVFGVYGFSLVLALIFHKELSETKPVNGSRPGGSLYEYLSELFSTLKIKNIRNLMIHSFTLYFFLYALVTYLPLYLIKVHGFDEIFSGIALSGQAVFSAMLAWRATTIADHLDWRKRASLGFALISVSFLLLPYWPEGSYLISLSFIIYGVGMGIVSPTIYDRVARISPPEVTGSVIAIFNTMKYIGMTAAPILIGLSLLYLELPSIFLGVGGISALWAVITHFS